MGASGVVSSAPNVPRPNVTSMSISDAVLGATSGTLIAYGVAAVLVSLTGYAFVGGARFSAQYQAPSNPLAAVGATSW